MATKPWAISLWLAATLALSTGAAAGPGAHGPNGEHLDDAPAAAAAPSDAPGLEAKSELFELVARLNDGELSIMIDRFATNEPVLNASIEVESGPLKAVARFHEDIGDYAVDDPALLKLLATPGEHPLLVTVVAGNESDLLEGVLRNDAATTSANGHQHPHAIRWNPWLAAGLIVLTTIALTLQRRKKHHPTQTPAGKSDGGQP